MSARAWIAIGLRLCVANGLLLCAARAQGPIWSHAGPAAVQNQALGGAGTGGPLAALALSLDGTTLYAGGLGGVWKFDGTAWGGLTDGQPVSALTISAAGVLYAGLGDVNDGSYGHAGVGILKSADGGATWTTLGAGALAGLAVTRVGVDPADANHLLAATVTAPDSPPGAQPGLYASSDGGATWEAPLIAGNVWDFAWDGVHVLAATATALELSLDDGITFSSVAASAWPTSWERAAVCPQPGGGFLALFASVAPGPSLVAVAEDGSAAQLVPLPPEPIFSDGAAAIALAADSGHTWLGGADLWERAGSGAWVNETNTGVAGGTVHGQQHAILLTPGGGLWLANDGGLWWAPANGFLTNMNAGLDNTAPLALTGSPTGLLAALDGGGIANTDAADWTVASPTASDYFSLIAADPSDSSAQSFYAVGRSNSILFHSSDGGVTWGSGAAVPGVEGTITALAAGPRQVWIGTSAGQLLDASGDSFGAPAGVQAIAALAISNADGSTLWVASGTSLWTSSDGGADWVAVVAPLGTVSGLALDPLHPSVIAVATTLGVAVSLDGGASWAPLSAGLPSAPVTGLVFDEEETLWAGTLGRGLWSVPLADAGVTISLTASPASAPAGSPISLTATVESPFGLLAGAAVSFSASEAGQPGTTATATSDSHGVAVATLPLPTQAGTVEFAASGTGPDGPVFSPNVPVTATAGDPAKIIVVSGANQSQLNGTVLAQPVVLEVADSYGNGVADVGVQVSDSGSFNATVTTDGNGRATVAGYALPDLVETVTLTAIAGALTTTWIENALATPGYTLTLTAPGAGVAPNQIAILTVQMRAIGGFSAAVPLQCSPAPGCVGVAPASLAPGETAQVSFDVGSLGEDETSVVVTVSSDAVHAASATLALQGLMLTPAAPALTVPAGATAALSLAVASVNGLVGSVAFAATLSDGSPLPSGVVASFNPATPTLSSGVTTVVAQLTVSVAAAGAAPPRLPRAPPMGRGLAWLAGLAFLCVWAACWRRGRWAWAVGLLALAGVGCGGAPVSTPDPPPAPQLSSYSLVLTATSNGLQASTPVTLTVTTP